MASHVVSAVSNGKLTKVVEDINVAWNNLTPFIADSDIMVSRDAPRPPPRGRVKGNPLFKKTWGRVRWPQSESDKRGVSGLPFLRQDLPVFWVGFQCAKHAKSPPCTLSYSTDFHENS